MELVEFELAGGRYALPMARVVELAPTVRSRPLPGAPANVEGLVNHRGQAVVLVALRRVFGAEGSIERDGYDDHLVIAEGRTRRYALRVDRVTGLRVVEDAALESGVSVPSRHVRGVVVVEGELLVVQDLDALLSQEDEAALDRAVAEATDAAHPTGAAPSPGAPA